jgi:hypothetical protein
LAQRPFNLLQFIFRTPKNVYFTLNVQPFKSDCLTIAAALLKLPHLPEQKTIISQFSYVEARKKTPKSENTIWVNCVSNHTLPMGENKLLWKNLTIQGVINNPENIKGRP